MPELSEFAELEIPDRRARLLTWLTPGRKLLFVGGITLVPALGLGFALQSLFAGTPPQTNRAPVPGERSFEPAPFQPSPTREVERLKAEVALSEQRQFFDRLRTSTRPVSQRPAPPTLPTAPRRQLPVLPSLPAPPPRQPISLPSPERLALLGSGQVGVLAPRLPQPETSGGVASLDPDLERSGLHQTANRLLNPEVASQARVPAGTLAAGTLGRPVTLAAGAETQRSADERFLVILNEPIRSTTGEVILPAGTAVLITALRVSTDGLTTLQAVAVSLQGREVPLRGVFVRAAGGLPLQAHQLGRHGTDNYSTLSQAALKGAEQGLAVLNRPLGVQQVAGSGTTVTGVTFGRAEPLAAAATGFLNQYMQTLPAATSPLPSEPLWLLPAGTAVELFFGQEVVL